MLKKLFKNKPIGFYLSLAASVLSLVLTIFYAAYMGAHDLFNGGVFVLYLFAFLLPMVYFFVEENVLTRAIPIVQAALVALALGLTISDVGAILVGYFTGSLMLIGTTASGEPLVAILAINVIALLVVLVACFMKQTKSLTSKQQAEVEEEWSSFKANSKTFVVKHKKPIIISGLAFAASIAFLIALVTVIIPIATTVHVSGITLDKEEIVMYETETNVLKATVGPENAVNKKFAFTSSDEDVVTVSSAGVLKAIGVGEATVTVTAEDGGFTDTCTVKVNELTVTQTTLASGPNIIHYVKGAKFNSRGVSIVATLSNGKTEKINARQHNLAYSIDTVDEKKVTVTASYEYRGKSFNTTFEVYGDVAEVATIAEFNAAMADTENIDYIRFVDDITFENFTLTRDIAIEGIVTANSVVLENNANVTLIGRLNNFVKTESPAVVAQEDSIFEISGSGTLEIETVFDDHKPGTNGDMDVYTAGVFSTAHLKISGVKLVTTGLHVDKGDLTVDGNADVIINGPGYVGSSTFNGVEANNGVINVDGAKFAVMFNGKAYVNRAAIQCMGLTVTNGATLVVDKTENADFHYGFAMWYHNNYVVTVNGGSTAKFNATKIGNQTDNQCFSKLGTLIVTEGATFEMNALRYFNGTVNGKFDSDVNITVNGVVLDMSKPITDMKFGEMGMTNCEIGNQPGSDVEFFVGDTYDGEGLTVNALFENSNISGKLSIELASGYEIEAEPFTNGWNTVVVKVGEKRVSFTLFAKPKNLLTVHVSTVEDFKTKLADETVGTIIMDQELTFDTLEINRDITIEGNMKVTTLTVSEGVTLFTLGRIWSDANMTINGKGTVNAMLYTSDSSSRLDHAAIRVGGTLNISEATVICSNLSSVNTVTIDSGAKVTVYGKTVVFQNDSLNGIHVDNGDLIIRGADTVLNVLFNDTKESKHPAALQANSILVDGATLIVGAAETKSNEWAFAIWFNGQNSSITATNGAQITFTITKPLDNYSVISGGNSYIYVQGDSSFTVIAPSGNFNNNQVKEGNVTVMTPEQA